MHKIDKIVTETVSKILEIPNSGIKISSNFENLKNFDSLNYVKIILEISKKLNLNLPLEELSEVKSVKGLIKLISKYS